MRRVVTIQQPVTAQTGTGATRVSSWSALANGSNIFADIDESPGKEALQAAQVNAKRPLIVTIRYLAGVTSQMRVVYGARTFQIVSTLNVDQRNRTMILYCEEHAP